MVVQQTAALPTLENSMDSLTINPPSKPLHQASGPLQVILRREIVQLAAIAQLESRLNASLESIALKVLARSQLPLVLAWS